MVACPAISCRFLSLLIGTYLSDVFLISSLWTTVWTGLVYWRILYTGTPNATNNANDIT